MTEALNRRAMLQSGHTLVILAGGPVILGPTGVRSPDEFRSITVAAMNEQNPEEGKHTYHDEHRCEPAPK